MPKFDFFHINGYGRSARRNGDPKAHVAGIVAEAERQRHACRHVDAPMTPIRMIGCSPSEAAAEAVAQADYARDAMGRKIRNDGVVMFAAVASYPVPTTGVVAREAGRLEVADPNFLAWRNAVLAWARKLFGAALKSAVLHLDEEYPHVHFFLLPPLVDGRLRHDLIHPGRAAILETNEKAKAEIQAETGAVTPDPDIRERDRKRAERLAYCEAMKSLLDDYHRAVGEKFGHERYGPGRRRRSRAHHLEVRRLERERDAAIATETTRMQQTLAQLRKHDEDSLLAREAEVSGTFLSVMRYRDSIDAELAAERRRGDDAEAALAEMRALLDAHGLRLSRATRPWG